MMGTHQTSKWTPLGSQITENQNPARSISNRLKRCDIPLFCSTPLPLHSIFSCKKACYLYKEKFFLMTLRLKNNAIVVRWSLNLNNFQLFGVLRGSTLGFDGSPLWYLTFYSNLSGRGVRN